MGLDDAIDRERERVRSSFEASEHDRSISAERELIYSEAVEQCTAILAEVAIRLRDAGAIATDVVALRGSLQAQVMAEAGT